MAQQHECPPAAALIWPAEAESQGRSLGSADYTVGAAVAAITAIVYGLTAARDIVLGDNAELITAAITLGVAHPPGYPLFTVLGHLFSLLPFGPLPFRVNLISVVCGVIAVVFVYLTALRLSGNRGASACAAVVLAFTPVFWSWSLVAEVFPLNNALAAAMIYLLVRWHDEPERAGFLAAAAFLSGLGLANQQTIVLLGPAVFFVLYRRRKQLMARPRVIALCAAALLLGLLPYAYLPWAAARHPFWNWGEVTSLKNFFAVVTRRDYGTLRLIDNPQLEGGSALDRIKALGASFGPLAGLLSLAGAARARRHWYLWFSLLGFAFAGPLFVAYANLNVSAGLSRFVFERFFLLAHVAVAPLMAFGVVLAADLLGSSAGSLRPYATRVSAFAVLLIVLVGIVAHYPEMDQSGNQRARRFAEDIFATLDPDSILLMNGDAVIPPLVYLQEAEGYRRDVVLVIFPFLGTDWYLPQLQRQYPKLAIPFQRYDEHPFRRSDGQDGTIRTLLEANRDRRFAVIGLILEYSLVQDYWYHRRGLVKVVEPLSKHVSLKELIAENEELLRRYRPPLPGAIKWKSLEPLFLSHYATPAFALGEQCRHLHDYERAREWYQRALAQYPSSSEIRQALAGLPERSRSTQ